MNIFENSPVPFLSSKLSGMKSVCTSTEKLGNLNETTLVDKYHTISFLIEHYTNMDLISNKHRFSLDEWVAHNMNDVIPYWIWVLNDDNISSHIEFIRHYIEMILTHCHLYLNALYSIILFHSPLLLEFINQRTRLVVDLEFVCVSVCMFVCVRSFFIFMQCYV